MVNMIIVITLSPSEKRCGNPYLILLLKFAYYFALSLSSVTLHDSIQEEAEFDGDPTLEIISDEKLKELEQPTWAKKILSCVQPKGMNVIYQSYLVLGWFATDYSWFDELLEFYSIWFNSGLIIVLEIAKEEEEEEEEEDQIGTSDEELEEDVFRKRKAELTSGAGWLPWEGMKSGGCGLKPV